MIYTDKVVSPIGNDTLESFVLINYELDINDLF